MGRDPRLHRFDHLVVLMLENRSFDNLYGYLYEHDEPKHFIPDEDRVFRGVAGRDDLVNDDGGDPPREYGVRKAPWERLEDMYAPYPNAGEFYSPNINRQVFGRDTVSGDIDELPNDNLMGGFVQDYIRAVEESKKWDVSESGCLFRNSVATSQPPPSETGMPLIRGSVLIAIPRWFVCRIGVAVDPDRARS